VCGSSFLPDGALEYVPIVSITLEFLILCIFFAELASGTVLRVFFFFFLSFFSFFLSLMVQPLWTPHGCVAGRTIEVCFLDEEQAFFPTVFCLIYSTFVDYFFSYKSRAKRLLWESNRQRACHLDSALPLIHHRFGCLHSFPGISTSAQCFPLLSVPRPTFMFLE